MQLDQPDPRAGDVGALHRPLPRSLPLRHRRRAAGLPRRRGVGPLALRRLGLAGAGGNRVHRRAGERQPHLPGRTPRAARRHPARRRAGRVRRRAQRLPRARDRRRVHPVSLLAALRRARRRASLRARRRRQRPRLRPRRLPAHRGPRRPDARRSAGGSLLGDAGGPRGARPGFDATDAGGGIRKVYVEGNGAIAVTDIRNCAVLAGYATALRPCPAATSESAAVPTAHAAFATGPNTVTACVEDLALDGAANRTCEQRTVWVDNACPGSAVGGGTELSAGFGDGADVGHGALGPPGGGPRAPRRRRRRRDRLRADPRRTPTERRSWSAPRRRPAPTAPMRSSCRPDRAATCSSTTPTATGWSPATASSCARSCARRSRSGPTTGCAAATGCYFSGELPGPACVDRVVKVQARIGKRRWQVFRTDRTDRGCALHRPLQAARHPRREALPLPGPGPAAGRLSLRARPLADREGEAQAAALSAASGAGGAIRRWPSPRASPGCRRAARRSRRPGRARGRSRAGASRAGAAPRAPWSARGGSCRPAPGCRTG